jgi:hypothetical protein
VVFVDLSQQATADSFFVFFPTASIATMDSIELFRDAIIKTKLAERDNFFLHSEQGVLVVNKIEKVLAIYSTDVLGGRLILEYPTSKIRCYSVKRVLSRRSKHKGIQIVLEFPLPYFPRRQNHANGYDPENQWHVEIKFIKWHDYDSICQAFEEAGVCNRVNKII